MKMNRNVVDRIVKLREQEYYFEEISKTLKISKADVMQTLLHHRPHLCKLLLSKKDVVIELSKEGKSKEEISDITGLENDVIKSLVMQTEMSDILLTPQEKEDVAKIDTESKKERVKKHSKRSRRSDFYYSTDFRTCLTVTEI